MSLGLPSERPARPMVNLNLRARRILQAVVSEYIATGDAVGSRTVTKRHGIDLSAATVRNVMSDLEVGNVRGSLPHGATNLFRMSPSLVRALDWGSSIT